MGALVSLPITAGATFISSFLGSCCSSALGSTFQAVSGARSSTATRILYAIGLTINALISWIAMSSNLSLFWPDRTCTEAGECGFFTVNRLNFAQGLFHILLACLLVQVRSTKNTRAALQNGFWFAKLFVYLGLVFLSTYIPNGFFIVFSKWVSIPSATLFILIGLVLLVDFAHEWAETCVQHVELEDEYSTFWKRLLIFGTLFMYVAALIMDIVMLVAFCKGGCDMNITAAVVNFIFTLTVSIASIHPLVQEYNPKCGLAQSSMVTAYCTYLTLSAMASAPDDNQCNPLVRSNGTRKMSVVFGSIFTFVAIAYTTTRAAANSAFQGDSGKAPYLDGDDVIAYDGITSSRSQLRREAVAQAVQEGSLPESALYANPWLQGGDDELSSNGDDEKHATKYSYSLFHLIFFLATQWITILLTTNVKQDDLGDFIPVGRTHFYSWVKILSAWICYSLYFWTLVAPLVLRDRFGYDF